MPSRTTLPLPSVGASACRPNLIIVNDRKDIDDLTLQIAGQSVADDLRKALPPRIAYRLRHWLRQQGRAGRLKDPRRVVQQVTQKMEQVLSVKSLKKNQFMARVHGDGIVKMDFGAEVPEHVRKAAMSWAKRRGLKPIESSLAKSQSSTFSVTYASTNRSKASAELVAQYVWEIPQ